MEWSVLDWNTPARDLYFKLGAKAMEEWTVFRMTPDAFEPPRARGRDRRLRGTSRHAGSRQTDPVGLT